MRLLRTVYLDSEYRNVAETNSRYTYILGDPIEDVTHYIVKHVSYPNTLYTFKTTANRFNFFLNGDAVMKYVELYTDRTYNSASLVSVLQSLLQVIEPNFTVSFNDQKGKLTIINNTTAFYIATKLTNPEITNSCLHKLGWHDNKNYSSAYVNTHEAEHILTLYRTRYISVCSNISTFNDESNNDRINGIVAKVALIDAVFGSILTYDTSSFASDLVTYPSKRDIDEITLYFKDDEGDEIDSTNGIESAVFICFYGD